MSLTADPRALVVEPSGTRRRGSGCTAPFPYGRLIVRIANLSGRLALIVDGRAVDVERASDGSFSSDPQAVYERWEVFRAWAAAADLPEGWCSIRLIWVRRLRLRGRRWRWV
ncbi:hypothetical protein GCM10020295_75520 [Streptomyces cinereospinus]